MSLRNKIICTLLCTILCTSLKAQTLVQSFVDPCTKKVTVFIIPLQGSTIVFMGKAKYFKPADVSSGAFMAWVNQVYTQYSAPCPVAAVTNTVVTTSVSSSVAAEIGRAHV